MSYDGLLLELLKVLLATVLGELFGGLLKSESFDIGSSRWPIFKNTSSKVEIEIP